MKIALIQEKQNELYLFKENELFFDEERILELQSEMISQNLRLIKKAAAAGVDIILTSEAINFPGKPGWTDTDIKKIILETQDSLSESCAEIAREYQVMIVAGMFRVKKDGKLYNSAVVFDRNGDLTFSYDKNFLAGDEKEYLTPGNGFPIWENEFGRMGIGICWDMQFPETARAYAMQDADMILCPTWGWEHLYGPARAYENGIYVAAAMAVPAWKSIEGKRSPSQVIAPDGKVLGTADPEKEDMVIVEIENIQNCKSLRLLRIGDLKSWSKMRMSDSSMIKKK